MNDNGLAERARERFFRLKHARLAPVFTKLHQEIIGLGSDVAAYMPTVYVGYTVGRTLFAAFTPRAEGYLDLGLALPEAIQHHRLHTPERSTWKHLTRHVHVSEEADIDVLLCEWLRAAYTSCKA